MTTGPSSEELHLARQQRLAGMVLAATGVGWLGLQWLGGRMGWPMRYAFLIDLMAMAAFIWALTVTWRVWRRRKSGPQGPGGK